MEFQSWKERFLKAAAIPPSRRGTDFTNLVYEVDGKCSIDVASVLMSSFSDGDDFGTQEAVVSVLASANRTDAIRAILEELPRLVRDAPEWADVLMGQEVERRPELLLSVAKTMPDDITASMLCIVSGPCFVDLYENAISFAENLRCNL